MDRETRDIDHAYSEEPLHVLYCIVQPKVILKALQLYMLHVN